MLLATETKTTQTKLPFDKLRMEEALKSTFRIAPQGMTREEKRAFMSGRN